MRKKTHNEFIKQMETINPNIDILTNYEKDNVKIKCKCKKCGNVWESTPTNLIQGKQCPECSNIRRAQKHIKTNQKFIDELRDINKYIIPLENYKGCKNKIKCKCQIHDVVGYISPDHLLRGETFCKQCYSEKQIKSISKTHKQFLKELYMRNKEIEVLDDYTNAFTYIKVRCKKCGHEWYATPSYLLSGGAKCQSCSRIYSQGESIISDYLDEHNINYIQHYGFKGLVGVGGKKLTYDYFIPKLNMLLEFQGQFHDGTAKIQTEQQFKIQQEHDLRKNKYAIEHEHIFIEIWYDEDLYDKLDEIFYQDPVTTTGV